MAATNHEHTTVGLSSKTAQACLGNQEKEAENAHAQSESGAGACP